MATLRQIKEKQTSVKTINKITKAMKLVASAKSKKAVRELKEYRDYYFQVEKIINEINQGTLPNKKDFKGTYWILIMSDLGLAGGYNHNILKKILNNKQENDKFIILGNKGLDFFRRNKNTAEIFSSSNFLEGNLIMEITTRIHKEYYDNELEVKIIYSKFISSMEFKPVERIILPIPKVAIEKVKNDKLMPITEYEPDKEELMQELETIYINSLLVNAYKESQASEHNARKNAMETATQNGEEMFYKLNIEYNRGRQSKITQEISEIVGGSELLK